MAARSYTFSHAVTRAPGASVVDGLRAIDSGPPDIDLFRRHHDAYVEALASTGAEVVRLAPLEAFPDAVFIEDVALCLPDAAIVLRPGAPSRRGEAVHIGETLARFYDDVVALDGAGSIEGGDILMTEREVLVGASARTDGDGIEALRRALAVRNHALRVVHTPADVLHFKTDCAVLDEETVLSTPRLAATRCFDGYDTVLTAEGEEASANAVRFNAIVVLPAGFPQTAERLAKRGYDVREIGNTEAAKLDGGMSCLSLRFSPPE